MGDILSPLDSLFLHLESPRTPMHFGSIGIFEGAPFTGADGSVRIDALRRRIGARLELVPRLRQRVVPSPLLVLAPRWEDDPTFDITAHVRQAALAPPGSEDQLFELSAEILSWPLDGSRPLWELWVVEGLPGGRVAIVEKVHHALVDGLGGVALASVMFDLRRHARQEGDGAGNWRPERPPSIAERAGDDLLELVRASGRQVVRSVTALEHPLHAVARAGAIADGLSSLLRPTVIAPRCSVNAAVGRRRRMVGVRQNLTSLRTVQRWSGATLNEVLLAGVAGGVSALHEARGEPLHDLQVMVPVGLRPGAGAPGDDGRGLRLGNHVSAIVLRLPLGEADPVACLRRVVTASRDRKRHHQPEGAAALLSFLGVGLRPGIGAVAGLVQRQPFVNLVVTNVPGPPFPLYAMGARMLEAFPVVPVAGNLSIGLAAMSYAGQLRVGILADRDRCPDITAVARGMERSFRALERAAPAGAAVSPVRPAHPGRGRGLAPRSARAS